jgi:thermitase
MGKFYWAVFFCIFIISAALGHNGSDSTTQEWILTRQKSAISWIKILGPLPELELIRTFGPRDKYALVKLKAKLRNPLPAEVGAFQRNYTYRAFDNGDPGLAFSWGLINLGQSIPNGNSGVTGVDIGASKAWGLEKGNKNIVVAILDTGIDLSHEDLKNNLWRNPLEIEGNLLDNDHNGYANDIHGWNFVSENSNVQDDNNHGTAVAGVIAADTNNGKGSRGVVENTSLMVVKILDENGMSTTERAVKGIQYAVNNGALVINASWGGGQYDQALFDTIQWANERGVVVVCAAGNESKDNDLDDHPAYPATFKLPNILSVAAHDNRGNLASFSSYGKETVHVAAPGVGIYTSIRGGYQFVEGTSFAAPFVSGVIALLKSKEPKLTPEQLKTRIVQTAIPMDYYMKEKLVSGGRLHAFNALQNIFSPAISYPTDWKRVFKSLETAHPYPNDSKLVYEISQSGATHIRVHFSKFQTEKQFDTVSLRDKEGKIAMAYSGKLDDFLSADVLGDSMKIEFVSDFSNTDWGFAVDYYEYSL